MTQLRTITLKEIQAAAAAYKNSDQTNPLKEPDHPEKGTLCLYTDPRSGEHCVAGQILADLGVPLPAAKPESPSRTPRNQQSIRQVADWLASQHGVMLEYPAREALALAQRKADGGDTWGDALRKAAL